MKFSLSQKSSSEHCRIIPISGTETSSLKSKLLGKNETSSFSQQLEAMPLTRNIGSHLFVFDSESSSTLLVVQKGEGQTLTVADFIKFCHCLSKTIINKRIKQAAIHLGDLKVKGRDSDWALQKFIIILREAAYCFDNFKSNKSDCALEEITFHTDKTSKKLQDTITQAIAISDGLDLCKNLGNTPANVCTPSYLAKQAEKLDKQFPKIKTEILDKADMKKLGMGCLLSVSQGSPQPPKLICMEYKGGKAKDKPIVFVGKGITFDTGGSSLKQPVPMIGMKYDMCGAATLLGLIQIAASLKLSQNIVVIVAASENIIGCDATKPGDVVTSMSGQTVEILNTDAEGRLVLCDALTYAEKYDPKFVIDIATLTGAIIVALGDKACGVMGNNQPLINKLLKAGENSHDRVWQLPLWDDHQKPLKSNIADLRNIGSGPAAGSITAAAYLAHFTQNYQWAHLDIAGIAADSMGSLKKSSATGRPLEMLATFLMTE